MKRKQFISMPIAIAAGYLLTIKELLASSEPIPVNIVNIPEPNYKSYSLHYFTGTRKEAQSFLKLMKKHIVYIDSSDSLTIDRNDNYNNECWEIRMKCPWFYYHHNVKQLRECKRQAKANHTLKHSICRIR